MSPSSQYPYNNNAQKGKGRHREGQRRTESTTMPVVDDQRTRGGQGPPKHFEKYLFYHMMYLYLQVVSLVNTTWPPQFVIKCLNTF